MKVINKFYRNTDQNFMIKIHPRAVSISVKRKYMLAARRNCSKRLSGKNVRTVYLDVCVVLSQNSVLTFSASTPMAAGETSIFGDPSIYNVQTE